MKPKDAVKDTKDHREFLNYTLVRLGATAPPSGKLFAKLYRLAVNLADENDRLTNELADMMLGIPRLDDEAPAPTQKALDDYLDGFQEVNFDRETGRER